jgi:thioredoxin 2
METVLMRCESCKSVNRVVVKKMGLKPLCHICKKPLSWVTKPIDVYSSNFSQQVLQDPGFVLVEFWAPSCGYCIAMNPIFDKIASDKAGIVKIVKINTMYESNLASEYNVMGTPHFVLFNGGQKITEASGAMTRAQLEGWIAGIVPL